MECVLARLGATHLVHESFWFAGSLNLAAERPHSGYRGAFRRPGLRAWVVPTYARTAIANQRGGRVALAITGRGSHGPVGAQVGVYGSSNHA
jgi:hypothetical protein